MNPAVPVKHLMTRDVVTVAVDASLSEVQRVFDASPFHHLPVLRGEVLVGMLSAQDLARATCALWARSPESRVGDLDTLLPIERIMSHEPVVLGENDTLRAAVDTLASGAFHALPVVDDRQRLVGLVTTTDLLRHFLAELG